MEENFTQIEYQSDIHQMNIKMEIFFCFFSYLLPKLEAWPDFVEHLRDDGDEDILHHPGQEEDASDEVEGRVVQVDRVGGAIHDVHPPLLHKQRVVHICI